MTPILVFEQLLNGLQFGLMLFLIAAGLTLVFGIMDIMNLAHGSFYMVGAYVAADTMQRTGSFVLAVLVAVLATGVVAIIVELLIMRRLVVRDHLAQVLGSYAIILIANDAVKMIWGPAPQLLNMPSLLSGPVRLLPDLLYSSYRLMMIALGVMLALGLYYFVTRTRAGTFGTGRRVKSTNGDANGCASPPFISLCIYPRCHVGGSGRRLDGADQRGANRYGRRYSDFGTGMHRDRGYRFGARCASRCADCGHGRYRW